MGIQNIVGNEAGSVKGLEQDANLLEYFRNKRCACQKRAVIALQSKEIFLKICQRTASMRPMEAGVKKVRSVIDELTETHERKRPDWCLEHQAS